MKELYKVRRIKISLLDRVSHELYKEIESEFGIVLDDCGILYFETHSRWDRYLGMTAAMTQVPVPTAS